MPGAGASCPHGGVCGALPTAHSAGRNTAGGGIAPLTCATFSACHLGGSWLFMVEEERALLAKAMLAESCRVLPECTEQPSSYHIWNSRGVSQQRAGDAPGPAWPLSCCPRWLRLWGRASLKAAVPSRLGDRVLRSLCFARWRARNRVRMPAIRSPEPAAATSGRRTAHRQRVLWPHAAEAGRPCEQPQASSVCEHCGGHGREGEIGQTLSACELFTHCRFQSSKGSCLFFTWVFQEIFHLFSADV